MRNLIFTMAAALTLAGCGESPSTNMDATETSGNDSQISGNPAQIKLTDIDFFNMSETNEIAKKLAPADAALFLEYVINWKAAQVSGDESKILKPDGTAPVTIGEATVLTKAVLAKNEQTGGN